MEDPFWALGCTVDSNGSRGGWYQKISEETFCQRQLCAFVHINYTWKSDCNESNTGSKQLPKKILI